MATGSFSDSRTPTLKRLLYCRLDFNLHCCIIREIIPKLAHDDVVIFLNASKSADMQSSSPLSIYLQGLIHFSRTVVAKVKASPAHIASIIVALRGSADVAVNGNADARWFNCILSLLY